MSIKLEEKANAIKYLKNIVINSQKYQFAAWLREKEKNCLRELNLPILKNYDYKYEGVISYHQYLILVELISEFEIYSGLDESEIKKDLYKNCINVIREEKIDKLLS
jgi:hypothetical protein